MSSLSQIVEKYIYNTLSSDATIQAQVGTRVYSFPAPQQTNFPLALFEHISSQLFPTFDGRKTGRYVYQIRGISTENREQLQALSDRITEIFENLHFTTPEGHRFYCTQLRDVSFVEEYQGGERYYHLGGHFEFRWQGV